jgi:hypothetical protein
LKRLLAFLQRNEGDQVSIQKFDAAHLLWYAGALIVIGALGLFSTAAYSQPGGWALTATALVYASGFTFTGHYLWHSKGLRTPGGLLITIAVFGFISRAC